MDFVNKRYTASISNRAGLAKALNIEKLMKKNKVYIALHPNYRLNNKILSLMIFNCILAPGKGKSLADDD